jgi:hypothetical protein
MDYSLFRDILNKQIFDNSKKDLIEKIAKYPDRYIGLFRPTKPKAKLLQNILQSNEIRFGDAMEVLFEKYFEILNFENLDKKLHHNGDTLDLDQLFKDNKFTYFVEQKVRDDHDSTKKRGQIANFEKKIIALLEKYKENELKCFMYFVDPSLVKNKKYYDSEIGKMKTDYNVSIQLYYGKDFWTNIGHDNVWTEVNSHLKHWKEEIPDMPSVNFDENAEASFNEIKLLDVSAFRKLLTNKEVYKEILPIIFPENKVLKLLYEYFKELSEEKSIYKTLSECIEKFVK